ncbi:uncharacterized protein LOC126297932 [Schistocerca gregaria]|uniref:uncharacterized protein LOC126297932 n=1 Tax=Schistocerca gregaria TaxID=7010 RepID=UPI00211DBD30|nr:uncharacterized protein LOC126297932 [Schistocerca gregaria]XP_049845210.1 uncharacterized protein LOC126297932 [Schistocerca gregaria]
MSFDTEWVAEKYYSPLEPPEHWKLRRKFLEANKDKYPEQKLISLAAAFIDIEVLGCSYNTELMQIVDELSKSFTEEYREQKKMKLHSVHVSASDAAARKVKGQAEATKTNEPNVAGASISNKIPLIDIADDDNDDDEPATDPENEPATDPENEPATDPENEPTTDPGYGPSVDLRYGPAVNPRYGPAVDPRYGPAVDPRYGPAVDPRYGPAVDPRYGPAVDPRYGPAVDPRYGPAVDPRYGPAVDPRYGPAVDPRYGPAVDPRYGLSVDPRYGLSVDPRCEPTVDPRCELTVDTGYGLEVDPRYELAVDRRYGLAVDRRYGLAVDRRYGLAVDRRYGPAVDPRYGPAVDRRYGPAVDRRYGPAVDRRYGPAVDRRCGPAVDRRYGPASHPGCVPASHPGCVPASHPGCVPASHPGCVPASHPGCVPASHPGCVPAADPGCVPAADPGCVPAADPGCVPAADPGCVPATDPGCGPAMDPGYVDDDDDDVIELSDDSCESEEEFYTEQGNNNMKRRRRQKLKKVKKVKGQMYVSRDLRSTDIPRECWTTYGYLVLIEDADTHVVPQQIIERSASLCRAKLIVQEKKHTIVECGQTIIISLFKVYIRGKEISVEADAVRKKARERAYLKALEKLQEQCFTIKIKRRRYDQIVGRNFGEPEVSEVEEPQNRGPVTPAVGGVALRMMANMGWTGGGLGKAQQGIVEPISLTAKMNRSGFGSQFKEGKKESAEKPGTSFENKALIFLESYARSNSEQDLVFAAEFTSDERSILHNLAAKFDLKSKSYGKQEQRHLVISRKVEPFRIMKALLTPGYTSEKYELVRPKGPQRPTEPKENT